MDYEEEFLPRNCSYLDFIPDDINLTGLTCPEGFFEGKPEINIVGNIINYLFYSITFVVGLCGNTLVIYVVTRFSKMQTVTNMYILNLALADEVFLFGIPFLITTYTTGYWPFGNIMCKFYMVTTSLNQFTSSLFLTIMSADRYIAVCHPINSPKYRTPLISRLVSLTAWSISALMIVPIFMYASAAKVVGGGANCNVFFPDQSYLAGHTIFTLYSFALSFGVPFTLIFIFYTLVILKLRSVGPKSRSKEKKKSHRKVTKMVLTVIMVYLFCWLPYWVLQMILITSKPREGHSVFMVFIFLFTSCLTYLNSAVNPILYAFLSDNFKKSFMKACSCFVSKEANTTLHHENSMFPKRRRSGPTSRSPFTAQDVQSREGTSSASPLSKEVSTGMTLSSRAPTSQTPDEQEKTQKNGKLLEVPTIHNSQL
ncbi:Somatostatin receptor type 2 [Armadillidium vulgare]|nr:Somatostatin receptor type 2 [Armadillidium vulgare]